jgi:hypothetical protein
VSVHASPAGRAQLAQINLARLRFPLDSPQVREFVAGLERINALAERSPGFVWRHRAAEGHVSLGDDAGDPLMVVNLSVWQSYPRLHEFVYRGAHGHYVRRRSEWFDRIATPATALWWVPAGHEPTVADGLARLRYLRRYGPTPKAFTVRYRFDPAGRREPLRAGSDRLSTGRG